MSRSFFVPRASRLHALYPLTKLVLVFALVAVGFLARSPQVPLALFVLVVLPLAWWGHIASNVLRTALGILLPLAVSLVLVQGLFYPGASSVLVSWGPFALKAEGLRLALGTAARVLLLAGAGLLLLFSTHPAALMLALRQHGLPSALAYIVVSAIQLIPQMQARAAAILDAQRARGLETGGPLVTRVRALIPLVGPLAFRALGDVNERAMALEARGFASPRPKTSYNELHDTDAERAARWLMFIAAVAASAFELWVT